MDPFDYRAVAEALRKEAEKIINKEGANIPKSIWHRYIIDKADNLFFKIPESDVLEMAVLPLEQFYDSRNKFVSAKKVQT